MSVSGLETSPRNPAPPPGDPEQKARIRAMFDAVAPRYDLINRVLSLGIDGRWRRRAVRELRFEVGQRALDLCTGTGDLARDALRAVPALEVVGVDISMAMMDHARSQPPGMRFVQGDAERLPLPDGSMDRAMVAFGIRNVASLERCLAEVARVLRPGGRFAVLEFTTPPNPLFRSLYEAYFHHVLPRVGGWMSGEPAAYRYLPDSVERFPSPPRLADAMRANGFDAVQWTRLHGGIAALHVATR